MPELKRLFIGSKMDKDSDERFVAPGDYTGGVNLEIISSEGGDSGVVRNKKGNTLKSNRYYDASTETWTPWAQGSGDTAPFGFNTTTTVSIGIHKHSPTNTIYTFLTGPDGNFIVEYNKDLDLIAPVLVDVNGILGFDSDTRITGISILEGTLGWVQPGVEPMAINIEAFKSASTLFTVQTQYKDRDFVLSDITMMRLSPLTAPDMALSDTLRTGIINTTTQANFTIAGLNDNSLSEPIAVSDEISFSLPSGSAYIVGDKIKLTADAANSDDDINKYEISLVATEVTIGGSSIVGTVINASTKIQDNILTWEVALIQGKPLFELLFPRFSYRWKYENNQYSTFSPFTQVAFLPDGFLYNSQKGYNIGMTNNVRKITLSGFDTPPLDVAKIDILYKASNSSSVYVVDTIDADNTEYIITDELFYKLVSANQLLRPWDAIPKSASALDSVANRFILSNYTKGDNLDESITFTSALVSSTAVAEIGTPESSIKSLRTYQAGVLFKDGLGRETPIFSDKSGVVKTSLEDATNTNKIQLQLDGIAPEGFTHFKYFIKDTSNEFYNLAADRLYQSEDQLATWISFPSSERNKVTIDSYLIAKKAHDKEAAVTDNDNKFKIIDIQDEAPTEIATVKQQIVESKIWFDSNFGDGNAQVTKNSGSTPIPNSKVFLIASDQENASAGCTSILLDELVEGAYIRFSSGDTSYSKFYKIASVLQSKTLPGTFWGLGSVSDIHAKIYVTEAFGEDINFLYTDPAATASTLKNDQVILRVYNQQELANQEQFTGRFFVKLASNVTLNSIFLASEDYLTLNAANCYNGGYVNRDVNFKIYAGGAAPRLGYTVSYKLGGLQVQTRNPDWANDDATDVIYDIVFEKRHQIPLDNALIASINTVGTKIRFSNHATVYTILESRSQYIPLKSDSYTRYWTRFDKRLTTSVSTDLTGEDIVVEIVGLDDVAAFTSKTPAVFETEPAEGIDLDIYHEASDAYPIAEYNDLKTLNYFNCYTFGNGVESNRIRDDYNAPTIDKGPRVSAVLDEPYNEETITGGLIWSGIFNSNSGVNNLNQFIIAEPITKEISPIYGAITKLHARDTDLIIGCEDKILQALADKDALYNADGSVNITASNAVVGDVRPFVGEFGMDAESFASYGFRIYCTDQKRGVALRLSRDGLTPIVKGYENELETEFKTATTLLGSYDDETGKYNLTMNGKTHQYSEDAKGWTSSWEVNPEAAITLNNTYYTVKGGLLYAHDDEVNRNEWYGEAAVDSSITFVFNDGPSQIKKFKTLSYEGDDGWIASAIETNLQSGRVLSWENREGKFYNYIKGLETTWDNTTQTGTLDTKEFSVQGIGNLISISGDTAPSTFTINVFDDPSDH